MIYSLNGILVHSEAGACVVECGGVGFYCQITAATQRTLPKEGDELKLFTHFNVREDSMDLYGFATVAERDCFRMLITISGVGPKAGLAILSELAPEQVAMAVSTGDSKAFTRASGVGPKLAQRIVLELTDKVKKMTKLSGPVSASGFGGAVSASANTAAAVNALTVLGYNPSDAAQIAAKFDSSLPVEEIIRLSLKEIGKSL